MTSISISDEVVTLMAAYRRAQQKFEGHGSGVEDQSLKFAFRTAMTAAAADPVNSTAILHAAKTKFDRYAAADPLLIRKARFTAGEVHDRIVAENAQAAAAASSAAMAAATAAATSALAEANAPGTTPGALFAAEALGHPDVIARAGRVAAAAVLEAATAPAHAIAIDL